MNKINFSTKVLVFGFLISLFILPCSFTIAQRKAKTSATKALKKATSETGSMNVRAGAIQGSGDVTLENYVGSPLKAIQFYVLATSTVTLKNVLAGSAVSDKKQWSTHHMIFPGNPDGSGKRTDTIKVVIFGNGWTVFPSGTSMRLLTLNYEQPEKLGTSADTVSFQITNIVGALPKGEAASVYAGSEIKLNLWK